MKSDNDLVLLATFDKVTDAKIFEISLASEGIETQIEESNLINMNPLFSNATGGIKLKVLRKDYHSAKNILDNYWQDREKSFCCPNCGSADINKNYLANSLTIFASFMLTMAWLLLLKKNRCNNCRHKFN